MAERVRAPDFARVLVAVYAVFALATGARAAYQLAIESGRAPLPYGLSALAAAVYLVAAMSLHLGSPRTLSLARAALVVEALGVIAVGALSIARPSLFADESVWSEFGRGYGFVPLVLPFVGLAWLARWRQVKTPRPRQPSRRPSARMWRAGCRRIR